MKPTFLLSLSFLLIISCKPGQGTAIPTAPPTDGTFRIAFGSCNDTDRTNHLWDDILALGPDLWIWGGDNVYADTSDMDQLRTFYNALKAVPGYAAIRSKIPVIGTWDDHDYGLNDGGAEFGAREGSQQEFLDFMGVPGDSPRRQQEGVYASHKYVTAQGSVKIIVLDTRYFRTPLRNDPSGTKRFIPHDTPEGTILGEAQWSWLQSELATSDADFNILVSSIQVLSGEHGFETWGNFPHELERLVRTIGNSGARGVFILSGDRHISEFSRREVRRLDYPLLDFTSSGLTHAYRGFKGEPNKYRVGKVVALESFGWVTLDFFNRKATFQIRGDGNEVLQQLSQAY